MFITPAYAQTAAGGSSGDPLTSLLVPILLMFVIFYFLLLRPQQQRAKQHREMVANVRRGDTVVTSGGIVGKVTKVADDSDEIEVELADNTRVRVLKGTLLEVRAKGEPVKESATELRAAAAVPVARNANMQTLGRACTCCISPLEDIAIVLTLPARRSSSVPNFFCQGDGDSWPRCAPAHRSASVSTCAAAPICCSPWTPTSCARTGSTRCATTRASAARGQDRLHRPRHRRATRVQVQGLQPRTDGRADAALKELRQLAQRSAILGSRQRHLDIESDGRAAITITPTEPGLQQRVCQRHQRGDRDGATAASTPWAPRKRTIVRQGTDRILVQVPGLQDTDAAQGAASARRRS